MNDADYQEWLGRLAWFEEQWTANRVRAKLDHREYKGVHIVSSELVLRVVLADNGDGSQSVRHYSSVDEAVRGIAGFGDLAARTGRLLGKR